MKNQTHSKYRRGWYVSNIKNGIKGKIVDVYKGSSGYEYQILASGTYNSYLCFKESDLIREGSQSEINSIRKVK